VLQQEMGLIQTQVEVCSWGLQILGTSLGGPWWIPESHAKTPTPSAEAPAAYSF
jgi:hypothetical protein